MLYDQHILIQDETKFGVENESNLDSPKKGTVKLPWNYRERPFLTVKDHFWPWKYFPIIFLIFSLFPVNTIQT